MQSPTGGTWLKVQYIVSGVNVFTVAENAERGPARTVEVLDFWDSLSVLVKTDAAKKNFEHNGNDRSGIKRCD